MAHSPRTRRGGQAAGPVRRRRKATRAGRLRECRHERRRHRHLLAERQPRPPGPGPPPPGLVVRRRSGGRRRDPRPLRRPGAACLRARAHGLAGQAGGGRWPWSCSSTSSRGTSIAARSEPMRARLAPSKSSAMPSTGGSTGGCTRSRGSGSTTRSTTPRKSRNRTAGSSSACAAPTRRSGLAGLRGTESIEGWTRHRDTVARFGRFPHRNAVLGRDSTAEELAHLAADDRRFGQGPPATDAAG